MKQLLMLLLVSLLSSSNIQAQTFQVDTIQYHGDINKYINIVVVGDGYTASQQTAFIADVNNFTAGLFAQSPWAQYINYFNIFAIRVISAESGVKHPGAYPGCLTMGSPVPITNPDNYFGSSFDLGIHRLVAPTYPGVVANVLAANFPAYDQVFMLANTPYYGGSGGAYATATTDIQSNEIAHHELGHSFADLADEYYENDFYAAERPNMTQQTNSALLKWANWIGFNDVGLYQHCCTPVALTWYKPDTNCKMEVLGGDFCPVCQEAIVEKIHSLTDPIISYSPAGAVPVILPLLNFKLTELMKPVPNTLKIRWELGGVEIAANVDSVIIDYDTLSPGTYILMASVEDTTELQRVNSHSTVHLSSAHWVITKNATGVNLLSAKEQFSYSIFPNPTSAFLNIELTAQHNNEATIDIVSLDGKLMHRVSNINLKKGNYKVSIPVQSWAIGMYTVTFKLPGLSFSKQFVKQ